ncbi:MAG: hypothetical protein ABI831_15195 [Betaproteobacteria bacterium]
MASHLESCHRRLAALVASVFWTSATLAAPPIIGFHDRSDPVKTLGWACSTSDAAPVRVHLYAEVGGALKLLDSQLADKRRDDLPSACTDSEHSFRFSDYARTPEGVALYGTATPVPMHVFAETESGLQLLGGSPRAVSFAPVGLWDPGLVDGRWRTDFDNPLEGSGAAPLLHGDCQFLTPFSDGFPSFSGGGPDPVTHCRYGSTVFPATNAASSGATWPTNSFWAVIGNVENAFDNPACTNGPPGQSLPIARPGNGQVFGVIALPDAEANAFARKKVHLVLNSWDDGICRTEGYGAPYLSFGAQADRGNNGVITYLNMPRQKSRLQFGQTLMDNADASPGVFGKIADGLFRYSQSHILIEAMWGGRKRWLFIELVPDPRVSDAGVDVHIRFNWHLVNSMLYPGADYVFKSAAVLTRQCRQERVDIPTQSRALTYMNPATRAQARLDYSFDLQLVFQCLNRIGAWGPEPMPTHAVPVTAIHFGLEQNDRLYRDGLFTGTTAPNGLWIAVDGVRVE